MNTENETTYTIFDFEDGGIKEKLTKEEVLSYIRTHTDYGYELSSLYIVETSAVKQPKADYSF